MSDEVWISGVMGNYSLGDKLGARTNYFGRDWPPASHIIHTSEDPDSRLKRKYKRGEALAREKMTEAMFVFSPSHWKKVKDFFSAGGFYAVRGPMAEVFRQVDLGEGWLFEFPIYEEDKVTPIAGGPFYLLNFGCITNTFVPEESRKINLLLNAEMDGRDLWADNSGVVDGDITLRRSALQGCDLWFEKKIPRTDIHERAFARCH